MNSIAHLQCNVDRSLQQISWWLLNSTLCYILCKRNVKINENKIKEFCLQIIMTKETIAIKISPDILEFVKENVDKKIFSSVSHGFEVMAFDFMEKENEKDESMILRLERLAKSGLQKSTAMVKETAEVVHDSTIKAVKYSTDKVKTSAEKVKESRVGQEVSESAGKVQESAKKAADYTTEKVRETTEKFKETKVGHEVMETAGKVQESAKKAADYTTEKVKETSEKAKETKIGGTVFDTAGKVGEGAKKAMAFTTERVKDTAARIKETISSDEEGEDEKKPRKIEIEDAKTE